MNRSFDNRMKARSAEGGGSSARVESNREEISTLQWDVLSLQRAVGNRAVSDLVRSAGGVGTGLQAVRIHTGHDADTRTEAEKAFALARGRDVYFGSDVDLETDFGQRVLAHELTHVIQQARGRAGIAQASQASLEGEASNVSGVGTNGVVGAGGAAPAGLVQKLEKQGVPESDEEERQWSIDVDSDAQKLTDILSSTFYSDADESEAIATLNRWARRQRRSEREKADREAGNLDRGLQFGMKGSYLDRLFLRLRSTQIWTRYGRTTAYEAMFEHFDRAQEVRTIRDTYSINYAGREEKADTARDERKEEDLLGESLFGWQTNRVESAGIASSPDEKAKAAWVIRRLAELRPEQLTPRTRILSEGVAREGEDFLLKRTHVVTAGDRLRLIKGAAREAVVTMLEFALWELGMAAVEAIAPELLAGAGGAEAAAAERAAAREGEEVATKAGAESVAAKEAAPKAVGDNVTSIVGTPRRGPIEEVPVGGKSELELNYGTPETSLVPDAALEPEVDLSKESGLELRHGSNEPAHVPHAEFEPQIDVTKESGLELARTARARERAFRMRTAEPQFGKPSGDLSGTGRRKGIHFNELNEAEIGPGRLRNEYDVGAGRPTTVNFELNEESLSGAQQTDRYFRRDTTVEGAQPHTDDFLNSGYDRGHLAPREAFKTSADAERLVDQTTNVVPMRSELNQGIWREAEVRANALAKKYNGVKVEIDTIYGPNPKTIGNGVPVPTAFRRAVYTLDGKLLEEFYYLNY
jgi:hypothetical protein